MRPKLPAFAVLLALLLISVIPRHAQSERLRVEPDAVAAWKKAIVILLASKKQYPPEARTKGGTAKIKFAIDRQGKLLSRVLVESAGSEALDSAALAFVERAEPFPEPPSEITDDPIEFTLPVIFSPNRLIPWAGGQWPAEQAEEQAKVNAKLRSICRGC